MSPYKHNKRSVVNIIGNAVVALLLLIVTSETDGQEVALNEIDEHGNAQLTELSGGSIVGERTLRLSESPYILRTDMEIELGAKLIVEPGVHIHFSPMVGLTVRGSIIAVVCIQINSKINENQLSGIKRYKSKLL